MRFDTGSLFRVQIQVNGERVMSSARPCLAVFLSCLMTLAGATHGGPIGSVDVFGKVRLGSVDIPSGATVLDGQTISTGAASKAVVTLANRTLIQLDENARARLGAASVTLEKGAAQVTAPAPGAAVLAAGLRMEPSSGATTVQASLQNRGRVSVAVLSGGLRVLDPSGTAQWNIQAGQSFLFGRAAQEQVQQPRSGGEAPGTKEEKDKPRAGGTAPGSTAPTVKKGSSKAIYIVLVVGGAGAAAGVVLSQQKRGS